MNKIIPHIWFDTQAKEAVDFYTSIFPNSKIDYSVTIHDVPSPTGDSDSIAFEIFGTPFMAINAGPIFKPNPSISFFINFDPSKDEKAKENLDAIWNKLIEGGFVMMPLQEYPFSKHYGWVQDKFGVSWQLMLTNPEGEPRPEIIPSLMFIHENAGKAEEAVNFYTSVFKDGKIGSINKYGPNPMNEPEGNVMFGDFHIMNTWIAIMDSSMDHKFNFTEGISLIIPCDSQEEIDYYWDKLSAVPEAEQCGWCKDKYGVSWQVWPKEMGDMMKNGTEEQVTRLTQAFLPMKKYDVQKLRDAFNG